MSGGGRRLSPRLRTVACAAGVRQLSSAGMEASQAVLEARPGEQREGRRTPESSCTDKGRRRGGASAGKCTGGRQSHRSRAVAAATATTAGDTTHVCVSRAVRASADGEDADRFGKYGGVDGSCTYELGTSTPDPGDPLPGEQTTMSLVMVMSAAIMA